MRQLCNNKDKSDTLYVCVCQCVHIWVCVCECISVRVNEHSQERTVYPI